MGKISGKNAPAKVDPVYVLGLDSNGKPRGARFGELKDNICSAAMDMNCRVLIDQPEAVSALGMKLPVGRVHGGGKVVKLFVPNIRRELYDQILEAARTAAEQSDAKIEAGAVEQSATVKALKGPADAALAEVRCLSPVTLPRARCSVCAIAETARRIPVSCNGGSDGHTNRDGSYWRYSAQFRCEERGRALEG
jgi:hypothetical protein